MNNDKKTKGSIFKLICIEVGLIAVGMVVVPPIVKAITNKYYRMSMKPATDDFVYDEMEELGHSFEESDENDN